MFETLYTIAIANVKPIWLSPYCDALLSDCIQYLWRRESLCGYWGIGREVQLLSMSQILIQVIYWRTETKFLTYSTLAHWGRDKMAAILLTTFFLNENVYIWLKISLKFVPKFWINNMPALVQIPAWPRPGDKPLSGPIMFSLLTHLCVTRPQRFNWVAPESCWSKLIIFYFLILSWYIKHFLRNSSDVIVMPSGNMSSACHQLNQCWPGSLSTYGSPGRNELNLRWTIGYITS